MPKHKGFHLRVVTLLAAVALAASVAGCGGGNDATTASPSATIASATPVGTSDTMAAGPSATAAGGDTPGTEESGDPTGAITEGSGSASPAGNTSDTGSQDQPATRVVDVTPVDTLGNPLPGWTPYDPAAEPTDLDCTYSSPASSSVGTDIVGGCGGTANSANACWIHPDRVGLTCAIDPWNGTYLSYRSSAPLTTVGPAENPIPEWLELDDGSQCSLAHGGAWGSRSDGLGIGYYCGESSPDVLRDVDTGTIIDSSQSTWTVQVGALGSPGTVSDPPVTHAVVSAYYAASPS